MAFASFAHKIEYPDNKGITLLDVAETLLAHDRLVKMLPQILERSVSGLRIEKIEITLLNAEEGSLLEEFAVQIWSTYQPEIQKDVIGLVEAMTGTHVPEKYQLIVTLLILALVLFGAFWISKKINPSKAGINIRGDYNTVLNVTAQHLHITSERLDEIIQDTSKGPFRSALVKAAQRFFKPAQRNGAGRIKVAGYGEISKETVDSVPTDLDIETAQNEVDMRPVPNVKIFLRAYDLDRREQGWYGVLELEELAGIRLPITLYPTIDPETIKGKTQIKADVIIEQRTNEEGEWVPKRIHVVQVRDGGRSKKKTS